MSLITTPCPCLDSANQQFCGHAIVEPEMCLIPPIFNTIDAVPPTTFIDVTVVPNSTVIQLVTCGLIVVCGLLRKTVIGPDILNNQQTFTEDIPFQAEIFDSDITDLVAAHYTVAAVDVSTGCYKFTCQTVDGSFYKLREKDVLDIRVTRTVADGV